MGDETSPLVLALDTATRRASVACCSAAQPLAAAEREVTTHSEGLMRLIDEVLDRAGCALTDLGAIVCGLGPGSFTGLRIGLATAKGLCLAGDLPLIGICSLDAIAHVTGGVAGQLPIAVLTNAGRGELFGRLYRGGQPLGEPWVTGDSELVDRLGSAAGERLLLAGSGAVARADALRGLVPNGRLAPAECHAIRASALVAVALTRLQRASYDDLTACEPIYVRAPDIRPPAVPQTVDA